MKLRNLVWPFGMAVCTASLMVSCAGIYSPGITNYAGDFVVVNEMRHDTLRVPGSAYIGAPLTLTAAAEDIVRIEFVPLEVYSDYPFKVSIEYPNQEVSSSSSLVSMFVVKEDLLGTYSLKAESSSSDDAEAWYINASGSFVLTSEE